MKDTQLSDEAVNVATVAITALANGGFIDILTGPKPPDASVAITTQVRLVRLPLPSPAFGAPSSGVALANAISAAIAEATGDGAWFRVYKSNGTTPIYDGTVGAVGSGSNLEIANVTIVSGVEVQPTTVEFESRNATSGF